MEQTLQILHPDHCPQAPIRAVLLDFDGTISTLRCGWEAVMREIMVEFIGQCSLEDAPRELIDQVDAYIESSTGIQTAYQMEWLKAQADARHPQYAYRDIWWYKDEYNRRLMRQVSQRLERLEAGKEAPSQYQIAGSEAFLKAMQEKGVRLFLASGTDHADVLREAQALGVDGFFEQIKGAPERAIACSKEFVIRQLLEEQKIPGQALVLIGDGKVEIALGAQNGTYTLGMATDEVHRRGLQPEKARRLIQAGADALAGDFSDLEALAKWMRLTL